MSKLLGAKEAADMLGIARSTFQTYCRAGKFDTAIKVRGTVWKIEESEIIDIIRGIKDIDFSGAWEKVYGTED